jgi:hypothetical protein
MAYQDAANYNKVKSMKGFPIGSIITWSGGPDTVPVGWIVCNGSNLSVSTYPLLYECIGTVYGGVVGSTFRLPSLTSSNAAIVDQFQGHFSILKNYGTAHTPEYTKRSDDPFWKTIGEADNGNQPNSVVQTQTTTVDVFGEQISKPDVTAKYGDFALSTGTVDYTVIVAERKTSDTHLPSHDHSYTVDGAPSYARKDSIATQDDDFFDEDIYCNKVGVNARVSRSTNDPPVDGTQMATVGSSKLVSTTYRAGGGNIISDEPVDIQEESTGFTNGDGFSGGDMYSHKGGTKYFFSSLSNDQKNFSDLTGHTHNALEYEFESKLKIINPGLVADCKMNNVTIDNTPGRQFCTININTATANLAMLFIIRAF